MGYAEVMIRIICGDDEFAVSNALNDRLDAIASQDLREANVSTFESPNTTLAEVMDTARGVPFMSDRRAVVVAGMLAPLEERGGRVRGDWADFGKVMSKDGFSIVNELIFVDYSLLRLSNANLKPLAAIAEVERYPKPKRGELQKWVRDRAFVYDLRFTEKGMEKFMVVAGDDTRRIDSELRKLKLYADGRTLNEMDVGLMVSDAHDEGIFRVVDAAIDGNSKVAFAGLHSILQNGQTVDGVLGLISRQLRMLIIANDLTKQGVPRDEIGTRLAIRFDWLLDKTLRQASRTGIDKLIAMHASVADIELEMKTGRLDRKLSVEVLIGRMAAL